MSDNSLAPNTPIPDDMLDAAEGCTTWGEYVQCAADNAGISFSTAWTVFTVLGESEAFDGFVVEMEDIEDDF